MPFCPFTNFTLVPCLHYSLRVLGTDTDPADPWPIFGGGRTPISLLWMFLLLLGIIFLLLKLGAFVLFDLERLNFRFHVASVFFVFCFLSGRSNVWRLVIIVMDTRGLKSQFSVNRHLRLVCASIANRVGHGWGPSADWVGSRVSRNFPKFVLLIQHQLMYVRVKQCTYKSRRPIDQNRFVSRRVWVYLHSGRVWFGSKKVTRVQPWLLADLPSIFYWFV